MKYDEITDWLLAGDVAIQYQTYRDLLGEECPDRRDRIAAEGWGARFLAQRKPDGHWGDGFYQPKWISSHYTLLDLKYLGLAPDNEACRRTVALILEHEIEEDGGVNPAATIKQSDVCVNGMFLNYATYFGAEETALRSIVDFVLTQRLPDGGFNCRFNRSGARHSSLHSTISMLEGFAEYAANGYTYRLAELQEAAAAGREFILLHRFFLSDRTGEIINPAFLKFPFPPRWKYDILRALDYFRSVNAPYDERMQPAIDHLLKKRRKDGRWNQMAKHAGLLHFEMEKAGQPGRWNTLRALRSPYLTLFMGSHDEEPRYHPD